MKVVKRKECTLCRGKGSIIWWVHNWLPNRKKECGWCNGTGKEIATKTKKEKN